MILEDSAFNLDWIERRTSSKECNSSYGVSGLSIRSKSLWAEMRESWIAENSSLMFAMKKRMDSVWALFHHSPFHCIGVVAVGDRDDWKETGTMAYVWGVMSNTNESL